MAIDDYDYRTNPCVRMTSQTYTPGGKGSEEVTVLRACSGRSQFRRKGTEFWYCQLCNKIQLGGRIRVKFQLRQG